MSNKLLIIFLSDSIWGKKNKQKEVAKGFALNYLIPKKLAIFANQKNLNKLLSNQEYEKKLELINKEKSLKIYNELNNFSLSFTLNKDKNNKPFGSINFKEILDKLEINGFRIKKNQLVDFQSLTQLGENIVKVSLNFDLIAQLKIKIE